jgi:hypothetical protein
MQPIRRVPREIHHTAGPGSLRRAPAVVHGSLEREYWRAQYLERDYVEASHGFRDYEPAFRYGWELRAGYGEHDWRRDEARLAAGWERFKGDCPLSWEKAAPAVFDAYALAAEPKALRVAA